MQINRNLSLALLFSLLTLSILKANALDQGSTCIIAKNAINEASNIRGLKSLKDVPCEVHSKSRIEGFLKETINTKLPADKLRMEERVYKTIGLIPRDFDYADGIVQLYLNQIGGYYDPDKKHFIMADWMPDIMQTTVAVHELTHALQDQYFNLSALIDPKIDNSDMLLAHSALVEGDATAVMFDYARKLAGQGSLAEEENIGALMLQQVVGAGAAINSDSTPQSLKLMLLFPYTSGLRFAHVLLRKDAYKEIDRAFRNPPRSTEEILHPEKYFASKPDFVVISEKEVIEDAIVQNTLGKDPKVQYRDTVGEFGVSALMGVDSTDKSKSTEIASGWGGDGLFVIDSQNRADSLVVWISQWDTKNDAEEFWKSYLNMLAARSGSAKPESFVGSWVKLEGGLEARAERKDSRVSVYFKQLHATAK